MSPRAILGSGWGTCQNRWKWQNGQRLLRGDRNGEGENGGGRVARWSWWPFSDLSRLREHAGNGNEESQNCGCFLGPRCSKYYQLGHAESTVTWQVITHGYVLRWDGMGPLWASRVLMWGAHMCAYVSICVPSDALEQVLRTAKGVKCKPNRESWYFNLPLSGINTYKLLFWMLYLEKITWRVRMDSRNYSFLDLEWTIGIFNSGNPDYRWKNRLREGKWLTQWKSELELQSFHSQFHVTDPWWICW